MFTTERMDIHDMVYPAQLTVSGYKKKWNAIICCNRVLGSLAWSVVHDPDCLSHTAVLSWSPASWDCREVHHVCFIHHFNITIFPLNATSFFPQNHFPDWGKKRWNLLNFESVRSSLNRSPLAEGAGEPGLLLLCFNVRSHSATSKSSKALTGAFLWMTFNKYARLETKATSYTRKPIEGIKIKNKTGSGGMTWWLKYWILRIQFRTHLNGVSVVACQ